jgi:hypothetical protein
MDGDATLNEISFVIGNGRRLVILRENINNVPQVQHYIIFKRQKTKDTRWPNDRQNVGDSPRRILYSLRYQAQCCGSFCRSLCTVRGQARWGNSWSDWWVAEYTVKFVGKVAIIVQWHLGEITYVAFLEIGNRDGRYNTPVWFCVLGFGLYCLAIKRIFRTVFTWLPCIARLRRPVRL